MAAKEYMIKLTLKQTWIILGIACGLFGTIFAAGMKTQSAVDKVITAKVECEYLEKIEGLKLGLGADLIKANEDVELYKERYTTYKKRFTDCVNKEDYINKIKDNIIPE